MKFVRQRVEYEDYIARSPGTTKSIANGQPPGPWHKIKKGGQATLCRKKVEAYWEHKDAPDPAWQPYKELCAVCYDPACGVLLKHGTVIMETAGRG